jgi:hypothetical protein
MLNIQVPDQIYARLKAWSGARNQTVEETLIPILESLVTREESLVDNAGKRKALQEMLEFMRERAHRYPPGFRTVEDRGEIYEVS